MNDGSKPKAQASRRRPESINTHSKAIRSEISILRLIHEKNKISRIDLAKRTGSSAASITAIAHRLIHKGVIVESGQESTQFGRKPVLLSVRNDAAYVVGVDLGSFFIRVVITDINANPVYKLQAETQLSQGREAVLNRTFKLIEKAIKESSILPSQIKSIGAGHSGVIDIQRGVVLALPRAGQMLEWRNVPLKSLIEQKFGLPCVLEDSVRTRAIAEKHFGLGANLSDLIYVDVGMGIGAAIFIQGKIYRGPGGNAGEFGHMTVDERGPLCSCGNSGCVEAFASCAAIIQAVRAAIDRGVNTKIWDLAQHVSTNVSIELIAQAAKDNDNLAFRVLRDAASHIAVALANVVNLLNPKTVIFGGALFQSAPQLLLEELQRSIKQRALEKSASEVELKVSTLGSEAGALGAARLVSDRALDELYSLLPS
jgi:glucokinase-like ROK family protein